MAFGDFLKKAATMGKDVIGDVSKRAGESLKAASEREIKRRCEETRQRNEIKRQEKEIQLQIAKCQLDIEGEAARKARQEIIDEIVRPTCDKGDCFWYFEEFFFTCPETCECVRKKYTKKDWGKLLLPEFIPYMKRMTNIYDLEARKPLLKAYEDHSLYYAKCNMGPETSRAELDGYVSLCFNSVLLAIGDIDRDFTNEFLPQYEGSSLGEKFTHHLSTEGYDKLLFAIRELPVVTDMDDKISFLMSNNLFWFNHRLYSEPFIKDFSLYDRSLEDFKYTAEVFATVLLEEELKKLFIDTSGISIDQLYDDNGNIKEAGVGGPKNGFYGDTIYNIVQSWGGEDGENLCPSSGDDGYEDIDDYDDFDSDEDFY